jgi:hypothetical protein
MDNRHIAAVDRRVEIIDSSDDKTSSIQRISQLRDVAYLVLLGEPGSGKTTVLETEARQQGFEAVKVRALLQGCATQPGILFLDALDEYRSDGSPKDKTHQLAVAIQASGAQRWWLSCRAEDWRKEADIQAIRSTTQGQPIVVAQLLPLNYWEAAEILTALGESDAQTFLDHAESLGANAFTQNPLSLRLLRAAVAVEGRWPRMRFELFESAVRRLAHEDNPDYRFDPRPAPDDLIAAADTANLIYLVTGARALWHSSALPPDDATGRFAYLPAHDLGIASDHIDAALDTPLFRGEGEAFEPMHRTIAEFTAARALARAVRGGPGHAAFPLSRALALITGPDGGPPTELRGLFAWFAAHLAKMGDRDGARRLIDTDAPTVMSYGDAAVFDTTSRRQMLRNLTQATPWFRSHESGSTSAGGLADEDLADDFADILRAPSDGTQRLYTVLDALTTGAPVASLKPLLREMALDPTRPDWVRRRAAEAWLNGQETPARARRELFDALAAEQMSANREYIRLHLVRRTLDPVLTTDDVRSLILGLSRATDSETISCKLWLKNELKKHPRPDLFDLAVNDWRREGSGNSYRYQADDVLDEALAAAIRSAIDLQATMLLQWVMNMSRYVFLSVKQSVQDAITEWLNGNQEREIALFFAINARLGKEDEPPITVSWFFSIVGRMPSSFVVRALLSMTDTSKDADQVNAMLNQAFQCVHHINANVDLYLDVYERLSRVPAMAGNIEKMRVHRIEQYRLDDMKQRAEENKKKARQKRKDVSRMTPIIPEIVIAKRPGILEWGAEIYFDRRGNGPVEAPAGMDALAEAFNWEIADAIATGWRYILTADFEWPTVVEVGQVEAEGDYYRVEEAALAGLDLSMKNAEDSRLAEIPMRVAISVLRKSHSVQYDALRDRLEEWAIDRLCSDARAAGDMLKCFWVAALDAGATDIALLSQLQNSPKASVLLESALPALLYARPAMPGHALVQALSMVAKSLPASALRDLVRAALADSAVIGESRRLWVYADFSLNPAKFDAPEAVLPRQRSILATFDLVLKSENFLDALDIDDEARALRRTMMIAVLGQYAAPSADYPAARHMRGDSREKVIRTSINLLGAMASGAVTPMFSRLLAYPGLTLWRHEILHARSQHLRLVRDHAFVHPTPSAVREALAGKAPVNSADLRAIVREELLRLRSELRTSAVSPWQQYWDNIGKPGKIPTPKIENICRNHLLERLRDRMLPYGIVAAVPEHQHAEETRSDIALLSHAGKTFPVEIKRDSNDGLWTAAATQLQGYANADTADGSGLYLVFWFNHPDSPMPARPDGRPKPTSAEALAEMLMDDLPEELRARVDVIVFDVSDRDAKLDPPPKKKARAPRKKAAS